jgi:hypothetical protein
MTVNTAKKPRRIRVRDVRFLKDCVKCGEVFSYVPSDVRKGWSKGDGGEFSPTPYRLVKCPSCQTWLGVPLSPEKRATLVEERCYVVRMERC